MDKFKIVLTIFLTALVVGNLNAQKPLDFLEGIVYLKVKDTSNIDLSNYDSSNAILNAAFDLYAIDSLYRPFTDLNATMDRTYRIHFSNTAQTVQMISTLEQISFVEYVERSPIYPIDFTPNDLQSSQWYLDRVHAEEAWNIERGSKSVVVAIVDNGVLVTHEDLKENLWVNTGEIAGNGFDDDLNGYTDDVNGADVSDGDGNPIPPQPLAVDSPFVHGTLCAGAASAKGDNGIGIASLGLNLSIMSVKCTPDDADDNGDNIHNGYDGVYYAIRNGADVISLSWGGTSGNFVTGANLINSARQAGIVVVAAAGNNNSSEPYYPAAYNGVIAVGASDRNDKKASFSNYGNYIDVLAPGVGIHTTNAASNQSYSYPGGTSLACPIVAALCGLIKSANPSFSPSQIETKVFEGADNVDDENPGFEGKLGRGVINAAKSLGATVSVAELQSVENIQTIWKRGDVITLPIAHSSQRGKVQLISTNGEVLFSKSNSIGSFQLPDFISPGVYFLTSEFDMNTEVYKIVIL